MSNERRRGVPVDDVMFEKNYRLQDIQLSKSFLSYRAMLALQARHGLETRSFVVPTSALSRFPWQAALALPPVTRVSGRRLVENTGLEPVTSWLQTRRSPS
jgi:hypothetical protein